MKVVEDTWGVHFSCLTVGARTFYSNMDDLSRFSGNLFAILVYCFKVGDVGSEWLLEILI